MELGNKAYYFASKKSPAGLGEGGGGGKGPGTVLARCPGCFTLLNPHLHDFKGGASLGDFYSLLHQGWIQSSSSDFQKSLKFFQTYVCYFSGSFL